MSISVFSMAVGVDLAIRMINIDEKRMKLQIWDTVSQALQGTHQLVHATCM